MSQDFKSQLEALIKKHCDDYDWKEGIKTTNGKHFKQGCELLIPILMKAIEQRDFTYSEYKRILEQNEIKTSDGFRVSFNDNVITEDSEDLLRILRGEDE